MKRPRKFKAVLLSLASAFTSSHSTNDRHRILTPIPSAQHLLSLHHQTFWQREFTSAQRHLQSTTTSNNNNECISPLQRWFIQNIQQIPPVTWESMQRYNITSLAYLYKHYIHREEESTQEYFGVYGERTNEMKERHGGLMQFWTDTTNDERATQYDNGLESLSSMATSQHHHLQKQSNVILLGMHGEDLSYLQTLIPTLQQIYHLEASDARTLALEIQDIIHQLPGEYSNPLLTSNAIATQSSNTHRNNAERDSIIVGDGVFTFLEWLNLSQEGPTYIHSHEYGHHLQYDMGEPQQTKSDSATATTTSKAEITRRLELMADVFASYYTAHINGGQFDTARLYGMHRSAYSLGDCESADGTHHGTPRQRECASKFGVNLALPSYVDGGYQLSPVQLRDRFDEKFDSILSLDQEVCEPVVEESTLDKTIYGEELEREEVPFFGDDGFSNLDIGVGGDSALSYLEPEVSWFDPKPINYPEQSSSNEYISSETTTYDDSESSISKETYSDSYGSYEPYQSYEASSPLESTEWSTEDTFVEDERNAPPETVENDNADNDIDDTADDWFEQTKWFLGETFDMSSDVGVCWPGYGMSLMIAAMTWILI